MNHDLKNALINLNTANELIKDKLLLNEANLYNEETNERWLAIYNQNIEVLQSLSAQEKIHIDKENDLIILRHHLLTYVPMDQRFSLCNSVINEQNYLYLNFKNTRKTRQLFRYIVKRLKKVNAIVNKIKNNPEDYI